jgi:REP element-mobilizing transposase RayT
MHNDKSLEELYPQRRRVRLRSYDYSWPGAYFVTICTYEKQCLFGNIENGLVNLNEYGEIAQACWKDIPFHFPEISNEIFIVMPNHVHGIISIHGVDGRSGSKPDPTSKRPLFEIVRAFKTYSSRRINEHRHSQGTPMWQRSYYEHVIRSEREYHQIGEYVKYNPAKWETDRENPNTRLRTPPSPFEY